MTGLALGDVLRRQRHLCGRTLRPGLGREIRRDLAQIALGQALGYRRHDRAVALAVPKIAQLLHEVALLLAPDDRHGLRVGRSAFVAMACRAEQYFRLDFIRGVRRGEGDHEAEPRSENHRKDAREHDDMSSLSLRSVRQRPQYIQARPTASRISQRPRVPPLVAKMWQDTVSVDAPSASKVNRANQP